MSTDILTHRQGFLDFIQLGETCRHPKNWAPVRENTSVKHWPQSLICHILNACETGSKSEMTPLFLTKTIWAFYQSLQYWEPFQCKFLFQLPSFPVQSHHNMKHWKKKIHYFSFPPLPSAINSSPVQLSPSFLNPSRHLWIWALGLVQSPTTGLPVPRYLVGSPKTFLWIQGVIHRRNWHKLSLLFILMSRF